MVERLPCKHLMRVRFLPGAPVKGSEKMALYRFKARHGPGHQSSSFHIEYIEDALIAEVLEDGEEALEEWLHDEWNDWCNKEDFDYPVGDVEKVVELVPHEHLELERKAKSQIRRGIALLDEIDDFPIHYGN